MNIHLFISLFLVYKSPPYCLQAARDVPQEACPFGAEVPCGRWPTKKKVCVDPPPTGKKAPLLRGRAWKPFAIVREDGEDGAGSFSFQIGRAMGCCTPRREAPRPVSPVLSQAPRLFFFFFFCGPPPVRHLSAKGASLLGHVTGHLKAVG